MAFATILNIYKWHFVTINIKAISEGLLSDQDTALLRQRKILSILTAVSIVLIVVLMLYFFIEGCDGKKYNSVANSDAYFSKVYIP